MYISSFINYVLSEATIPEQLYTYSFILFLYSTLYLGLTIFASQDVQTVGDKNLLRNLISHANLISYTLFKCVLFKEDSTLSMA